MRGERLEGGRGMRDGDRKAFFGGLGMTLSGARRFCIVRVWSGGFVCTCPEAFLTRISVSMVELGVWKMSSLPILYPLPFPSLLLSLLPLAPPPLFPIQCRLTLVTTSSGSSSSPRARCLPSRVRRGPQGPRME
jgi:hypothetical protein